MKDPRISQASAADGDSVSARFFEKSDHVSGFPKKRYSLLGINNRDLRTFKTDLGNTLRMAEFVEDRSVLVSESGIHTYADIKKLAEIGVSAVLVGESLMRSPDIGAKVRELFNT